MRTRERLEYGDFQTPEPLAEAALRSLRGIRPATVLEPTCGEGAFLRAASRRFPRAELRGYELMPEYARRARASLPRKRSRVDVREFFSVEWERELDTMPEPLLVVGNPPWVTSAALSVVGSENAPPKENWKGFRGYDALTGKSNFDISEWMLVRLLGALQGRRATLAVLCKSQVARRVLELAWKNRWPLEAGGLYRIDSALHFGASVDAVFFVAHLRSRFHPQARFPVYAALAPSTTEAELSIVDGSAVPDAARFFRTERFSGVCQPEWRSGVKHDCARVMELSRAEGTWRNGLGEPVDVEPDVLFPLLKSSDVANGRLAPERALILPQRSLGEDPAGLGVRAPKAWAYLVRHATHLEKRQSSIYRGRPPFSVFGVGEYSFSPWKVAISGLYKKWSFALVGPAAGRPVVFDDTCYFLPFSTERRAKRALAALRSRPAAEFFAARVFWDQKRPINKALLQSLDLERLQEAIDP